MGTNNATEAELALLHLADIRPVYSARTEAQLYSILSSLNRSNATVMLTGRGLLFGVTNGSTCTLLTQMGLVLLMTQIRSLQIISL